ncbi:hypothetical protein TNCV_3149951 [Trichonephila clavipes]|nr:hypothetical protein TNCV_3149951 [Trichonephila clavipes]
MQKTGFQILNDDGIVTSLQEVSNPVDHETDDDEDNNNNNESSKAPSNADSFSALRQLWRGSGLIYCMDRFRLSEQSRIRTVSDPIDSGKRRSNVSEKKFVFYGYKKYACFPQSGLSLRDAPWRNADLERYYIQINKFPGSLTSVSLNSSTTNTEAYCCRFKTECIISLHINRHNSVVRPGRYAQIIAMHSEGIFAPCCQVIYSQFGWAIHQNDHQARRRFVEWAQNEIAVVPDFHKRILFSDEAHFWLNGYVNKQNCLISSEANPQVYVETPLHPEKLTVWCALWAGGILLQKR